MKNNTIDKIKEKEREAEERVKKAKKDIEDSLVLKKEEWQNKEKELLREYDEKIRNLPQVILKEKEEIDIELAKRYKKKIEEVTKKTEKNINNFKEEVLKKI